MKNVDIKRLYANVKQERVTEFLARGGKVTVCKPSSAKRVYSRKKAEEVSEEDIDMDSLPDSLKITLGLKS